jgi:hypothetical protein
MRMGIGIGWPNASASNNLQGVYFDIIGICGGIIGEGCTSQLVGGSLYQPGDYVDYDNNPGPAGRVMLGDPVENAGETIYNISGPAYTSCPT